MIRRTLIRMSIVLVKRIDLVGKRCIRAGILVVNGNAIYRNTDRSLMALLHAPHLLQVTQGS
jgi:hypothetical protein